MNRLYYGNCLTIMQNEMKSNGHIQKQNFLDFCRTKGSIEINGELYPRLQILCVEDILNGVKFNTPLTRGRSSSDQMQLFNTASA